jgi:hypothetical protein
VSQYDREWFPGFENRILVGAEDVNGTGEVILVFSEDYFDGKAETVIYVIPWEKAAELAEFIKRKADKARDVQRRE